MNREERDQQLFDNIAQNFDKKDTFNSTSIIRKKRLIRAVKPIIDNNNNLGNQKYENFLDKTNPTK